MFCFFLHILMKYIYDLLNVFRRKWLNLPYTDFNVHGWSVGLNVVISYVLVLKLSGCGSHYSADH